MYAQYSNYYNVNVNQNVNANINKNVSGSVYEYKTITTIDYGALQLANAQKEKNRLESIKYTDEQQRRMSLEIASDPVKAFDYGFQNTFTINGKDANKFGFKHFTMSYKVPNNSLFTQAGAGRFENVSSDGVTTEILFSAPVYNRNKLEISVEKMAKMDSVKVGALNEKLGPDGQAVYVHKKDIHRATVFGFKGTLIWEDDYQYTITDNYYSFNNNEGNGVFFTVKVRYYGDKDKITFEQLEGRKYYLQRLIEKVISTVIVNDMKY
jgi:hypothetical protein